MSSVVVAAGLAVPAAAVVQLCDLVEVEGNPEEVVKVVESMAELAVVIVLAVH